MDFSKPAIPRGGGFPTPVCPDAMGTHIVHAIPGRVRLRIPSLRWSPELAGPLEALLGAQPGITGVSVNRWCHSVTLNYDSLCWTSQAINAFLRQLRRLQIEEYKLLRSQDGAVTASWIQPSTLWRLAGYFALVIGIILFALPMVPGGTPLLFLSTVCFSRAAAFELETAAGFVG